LFYILREEACRAIREEMAGTCRLEGLPPVYTYNCAYNNNAAALKGSMGALMLLHGAGHVSRKPEKQSGFAGNNHLRA